ncbi:MAG TPA: LamB/YcsF family protein, partial [Vicinamibacteria bacterium]|nr:LamB/YcsF family protein [Vicinamibacteria bacterium]
FADRRYRKDGTLRPRSLPDSVLLDPDEVALQALSIARDGVVTSDEGTSVRLAADTLCLHGDTPHAVALAHAVKDALVHAGIGLRALSR